MGERFIRKQLIGTVAAELGMKARTLRYYESIGLLPRPERSNSGYRVYDGRAAQRVGFITKAKSLGLTLKEIGEILAVYDSGEAPCRNVQQLLRKHLDRIEEHIRHLRSLKVDLRDFLADWPIQCETNGNAVCPRIEDRNAHSKRARQILKGGVGHGKGRVPVSRLRSVPDGRGEQP